MVMSSVKSEQEYPMFSAVSKEKSDDCHCYSSGTTGDYSASCSPQKSNKNSLRNSKWPILKTKKTINHWCSCISPQSFSSKKKKKSWYLSCLQSEPRSWYRLWPEWRWFPALRPAACPQWLWHQSAKRRESKPSSQRFFQVGLLPSTAFIAMFLYHLIEPQLKTKVESSTCHEVLLNLLVHSVESSVSVERDQLSLSVFPGPGFKLTGADVFVAQAQRPQGGVGKLLEQTPDRTVSSGVYRFRRSAVPRLQQRWETRAEKKTQNTHVQSRLRDILVSGVWGQSLIDDGVGSFAVEANTTVRTFHWGREEEV